MIKGTGYSNSKISLPQVNEQLMPKNFIQNNQNVLLMVGLQGSGKTTSSAKIALKLQKEGKKVLLASLDTYRPAAQEQLTELGQNYGLNVLPIVKEENPLQITKRALKEAKLGLYDILILDTAGRLHIDSDMMQEVADIKNLSNPKETLLVVDSLMGQDALNVAQEFTNKIGITYKTTIITLFGKFKTITKNEFLIVFVTGLINLA